LPWRWPRPRSSGSWASESASGFALFLLVGNPGSGTASAPELLPGFWRAVGPYLPPGAGGTALRNTAYFDGSALAQPLWVLAAYALAGAGLVPLAGRRRQAQAPAQGALRAAIQT
jgi:hypothetical protein